MKFFSQLSLTFLTVLTFVLMSKPLWDVGAGLSDETVKTEAPCRSRCGTIKIPPCSKALSAEHRPKFAALLPVMVTAAR
jgi:hypothetical protein